MSSEVGEGISWIWKMFLTLVIAVIAIALISMYVNTNLNTIAVQRSLMVDRILYSPDGPWLIDNQGMMQPGVLDLSKLAKLDVNSGIDSVFNYPPGYGGARLSLIDGGSTTVFYINQATFNTILTRVQNNVVNGGSIETHAYPVLIADGTARRNGLFIVVVAVPETT